MSTCGDGEYSIFAFDRSLQLFDDEFVSNKLTIKECILEALPKFPQEIADMIADMAKDHVAQNVLAQDMIRKFNLTQLEAEAVLWWTADVSKLSSMKSEESPCYVGNSHLRSRDAPKIRLWRDYFFFFHNALQKLPPVHTDTFRGEKTRAMELSKQYAKDAQVHYESNTIKNFKHVRSDFFALIVNHVPLSPR
jgi:hypothetical protein